MGSIPACRAPVWGMRTLADRVRIMDGRLDIDSAPGSGTRVTIRVPGTCLIWAPGPHRSRTAGPIQA